MQNYDQNFVFFCESHDRVQMKANNAIYDVVDSALTKDTVVANFQFWPTFFNIQFLCIYCSNLNLILQICLDNVVRFCGYVFNNITLSFIQLLTFIQESTFYPDTVDKQ